MTDSEGGGRGPASSPAPGSARGELGLGRVHGAGAGEAVQTLTLGRCASDSFTFSAGYSKSSSLPAKYAS